MSTSTSEGLRASSATGRARRASAVADDAVAFFHWYNHQHRHFGIALFTPADVHRGLVELRLQTR